MKFMKDFGSSRRSSMSSWSYNPYCRRLWIQSLVHIDLCFFDIFFCLGCIGQWPIGSGHSHAHVWQGDIETAVSELHPFLVTAW